MPHTPMIPPMMHTKNSQSLPVLGVRVLQVYDSGAKIKELAYLSCQVQLEYDGGVPAGAGDAIGALFARETLPVEKKGKNGIQEQDIIPMIRSIEVAQTDDRTVQLKARVCCQNPTLNPMQLHGAILRHLPQLTPDFAKCERLEVYDNDGNIFR